MPGQGGLETLSDIQAVQCLSSRPAPGGGAARQRADRARGGRSRWRGCSGAPSTSSASPTGRTKRPMRDPAAATVVREDRSVRTAASTAVGRRRPATEARLPHRPIHRPGRFHAVAIGSSTGGPEALARLLPVLTRQTSVPLFIVQHLPPGMTGYFADSLGRKCDYRVVEASARRGGRARHRLRRSGRAAHGRPEARRPDRHRPQRSAAGERMPAVGGCSFPLRRRRLSPRRSSPSSSREWGCDGAKGLGPLKRNGAYVIAQDEASSVVWGMPGAAAATNQVDEVLPLERIGPTVASLLGPRTTPCN